MTSFHRSLATITAVLALAGAGQVRAGNSHPPRQGNNHPQVRQPDNHSQVRRCVSDSARAANTCLNHGRGAKCEKAVNQAIKSCEQAAAGKPGKK
jgi:hypothetical protein